MTEPNYKPGSLAQMKRLQEAQKPKIPQQRQQRPNYRLIHQYPLPLAVYPLPAFIPHNPLSYVRIAYAIILHYFSPPTSHVHDVFGYFDSSSRSVHVTDPKCVRALWEMGFFGKGSLSRSEPTWLDQEKKRLGLVATSTSEEATEKRRKEREMMKRERARVEQEILLDQIDKEKGVVADTVTEFNILDDVRISETLLANSDTFKSLAQAEQEAILGANNVNASIDVTAEIEVADQEHLQLSLEEAFFLIYALQALRLVDLSLSNHSLLSLFRQNSYFPPVSASAMSPDDPFLVNYVVYHHYRSLGWVIREGVKFAVDYLLYESGPVFKHAAFAIMIIPSYSKDYWKQADLQKTATQRRKGARDWTWMHCVNRVQTQVLKTLVLCYVDIPAPYEILGDDVGAILRQYKVREFSITRWSANRNRD